MISVIIPCHDYGRFLTDAVNSLIGGPTCLGNVGGQTLADFEIIIINDASTDDTESIATHLCHRDSRIALYSLDVQSGTAAALNAGIARAERPYIYILSADDLVEGWTLKRMLAVVEDHPHHVCYGSMQIVQSGRRGKIWHLTGYDFEKVITKNPIPAAGVMYERACWEEVGGYPEEMRWGREGWAFNIACGLAGWCGHNTRELSGYLYRWDGQNRSSRTAHNTIPTPDGTPTWREFYEQQVRSLFPHAYSGDYESMCKYCGSSSSSRSSGKRSAATPPPAYPELAGKTGMVIVDYLGRSSGDQTYHINGTSYKFGGVTPRGYVAVEHAETILAMHDRHGELLFRIAP